MKSKKLTGHGAAQQVAEAIDGGHHQQHGDDDGSGVLHLEQRQMVFQHLPQAASTDDAEDAYDADADKAMFLRCAVFGTVCLPIFALIDMGMTIVACFRPSSYAGCFRSLR